MDNNYIYTLLMSLIRHQMTGTRPTDVQTNALDRDVIEKLYNISHRLDFSHVAYNSLKNLGVVLSEELEKKYKKDHKLASYRATMILYDQAKTVSLLKDEKIDFVLLKGAVIRELYPKNVIRTSCDIDILIHEEDMESAAELLRRSGYKIVAYNFHDIAFVTDSDTKVELHFNICENDERLDIVLKDAWNYVVKGDNGNLVFTNEFFLFHQFAHMEHHFIHGGCGIKPFIDLYVVENSIGLNFENIKALLDRAKLYDFAREMTALSKAIFDGEFSEFQIKLLSYIFDGGAYGRIDNKVALGKIASGGTFGYLLKRFFLPYKDMKDCYPILEKLPFLLTIFWVVRIFHRFFSKDRRRFVAELANSASNSKEKLDDMREIQKRLGL